MTSGPDSRSEDLIWDAQGQPFSRQFDDVYFSRASGIDESRHVFLEQNHLPSRWSSMTGGEAFIIGETGFGTGLNFLTAWDLWRRTAPADGVLHFVSVEKYPLTRPQLAQALALWPELAHLSERLLQGYPPVLRSCSPTPAGDFHRLVFDEGRVHLTLIFEDATEGLAQLLTVARPGPQVALSQPSWGGRPLRINAWFLDGFAPAKNPDMWREPLFQLLAQLSGPDTRFATFTAASAVRRGLADAGFDIEKVTGFGRKRHMLRGQFRQAAARQSPDRPDLAWHAMPAAARPRGRDIVVVGAGLAGCHSARALAERGFQVTVLEKNQVASGASGNPQGVIYAKASSQNSPLTLFNLAALQFATRYYHTRTGFAGCGAASGVFHLAQNERQAAEYRALAKRYRHEPEFVRWIEHEQTEAECGVALTAGGLLFSQAGWLNPRHLCSALLNHPNISLREHSGVEKLVRGQHEWTLLDSEGEPLAQASQVVLASATDLLRLAQTAELPVKPIRGQISRVPATAASAGLRRAVCGRGYIAPAVEGRHCLGASFNLASTQSDANPADDADNLEHVAELSPALRAWTAAEDSRVGFRCATPDYLPLVGPAPVAQAMVERFGLLRHNAKAWADEAGPYHQGLFVNVGHGSRGLAYTPLCAELLAAMLTGVPLPLSHDMATRLHPARFLIRDLKRNRL